jgi:predicted transcriptional regulator
MKPNRDQKITLNQDQMRCLTSSLRTEILSVLMSQGPLTAIEIGACTGYSPKSLYYPIKKLITCGLVQATEVVRSNVRSEQRFDASANEVELPHDDPMTRELSNKALVSAMAVAHREVILATSQPEDPPQKITCIRSTVRLNEENLAILMQKLAQIAEFIKAQSDSTAPTYSLTMAVTPRKMIRHRKRPVD